MLRVVLPPKEGEILTHFTKVSEKSLTQRELVLKAMNEDERAFTSLRMQ